MSETRSVRDVAVDTVRAGLPEGVTISPRGRSGWKVSARPGRFNSVGLSSCGVSWRSVTAGDSELADVLRKIVDDVSTVLADAKMAWRGLTSGPVTVRLTEDRHWLRATLLDSHGGQLLLPPVAIMTVSREQVATNAQAAAELSRLRPPQPGRPWDDTLLLYLVRLCLDEQGRLRRDGFIEACLRLAALCDLVFAGRLTYDDAGWTIDIDPIGYEPVDRLLSAVLREPDRDLSWWIGRGPALQRDLVAALIAAGRWQVRTRTLRHASRRYIDAADPTGAIRESVRRDLSAVADDVPVDIAPELAALAACATLADLIDSTTRAPAALLAACGPAQALLEGADTFLADARARQQWADAMRSANPSGASGGT